jgi:RNA polymerase sigma factor (TIGR02999 family)
MAESDSSPRTAASESDGKSENPSRDQLFASFYSELHRVAVRELRRNLSARLSPTTLLHETFLSFSLQESWGVSDRSRFLAYATRAMRGLIIDGLRRGSTQKRGGEFHFVSLCEELMLDTRDEREADRLREALEALEAIDARLAECVDLKFFGGFSTTDIAQLWTVSERTVQRDWDKARLILRGLLRGVQVEAQGG